MNGFLKRILRPLLLELRQQIVELLIAWLRQELEERLGKVRSDLAHDLDTLERRLEAIEALAGTARPGQPPSPAPPLPNKPKG